MENVKIKNFELSETYCKLIPISAKEYDKYRENALPIFEDYGFYLKLYNILDEKEPDFNYPKCYAALKTLFGDSTTLYDDFKCSYGYPFLLFVNKVNINSLYIFNFTDIKGGFNFLFSKLLMTFDEINAYKNKLSVLHKPFEEAFSKYDMKEFMTAFIFYLVGFIESYQEYFNDNFIRTQNYCKTVYGFINNQFFEERYEDEEKYIEKVKELQKNNDITINKDKKNY